MYDARSTDGAAGHRFPVTLVVGLLEVEIDVRGTGAGDLEHYNIQLRDRVAIGNGSGNRHFRGRRCRSEGG